MDQVEAMLLLGCGGVVALVVWIVAFRPFAGIGRSGDNHEGGAWAWIGANHRSDGDCGHDGASDGGGGGD